MIRGYFILLPMGIGVNIKIVNKKQLGLFAMNILVNAGKKFEIFEQ
jgi:hypothetical protein